MKKFSEAAVKQHNSGSDAWLIIHGKVYDVTSFLDDHPGGKKVLLKAAGTDGHVQGTSHSLAALLGTDASKQFDAFHSPSVLTKFGPKLLVGEVGEDTDSSSQSGKNRLSSTSSNPNAYFGDMVVFGDPYWYMGCKSPYYTDNHLEFRNAVRHFIDTDIMPFCHEWDETKQIPKSLIAKMADMNVLAAVIGVPIPEGLASNKLICGVVPPSQYDFFHWFILFDEMARCGSGGLLWHLSGGLAIGLPPIIKFASSDIKSRVVPPCLSGEKVICLAITEPSAGSDVANIQTEARDSPDGTHYIVNGNKKWITNGVFADYFTTAVRTGDSGSGGISLLLIERSMPGITTRQMQCSGLWSSGTTYISFEDVHVPKSNLIGKEGEGFKYIMYNFNQERLGIAIQATRFARVCYEESVKYGSKRKTFGKRLVEHPVIRNKLAHMARHIEASYAWLEVLVNQMNTMSKQEANIRLGGAIALMKAQATQTFEFCAREAAQIFGGLSYTRGGQGEKIERLYREVRGYAIPGGSEEIMLDLGIRQSLKLSELAGAKL